MATARITPKMVAGHAQVNRCRTIGSFLAALAACLVVGATLFAPASASARAIGTIEIAQSGLPAGSRVDQPLRRGPSGAIESIDPTMEKGAGPRRCAAGTICVGKDQAYPSWSDALAQAARAQCRAECDVGLGVLRQRRDRSDPQRLSRRKLCRNHPWLDFPGRAGWT